MTPTCETHPDGGQDGRGRCLRCSRLVNARSRARKLGAPLCVNGHGLVRPWIDDDGQCVECGAPAVPPGPPETWLDWAAVYQALQGRQPMVRPLTKYETVCAILTLCRRNDWNRTQASAWLRANTSVSVPPDNGKFLAQRWLDDHGLKPITLSEAIGYENEPDCRLDLYTEKRERAAALRDQRMAMAVDVVAHCQRKSLLHIAEWLAASKHDIRVGGALKAFRTGNWLDMLVGRIGEGRRAELYLRDPEQFAAYEEERESA